MKWGLNQLGHIQGLHPNHFPISLAPETGLALDLDKAAMLCEDV